MTKGSIALCLSLVLTAGVAHGAEEEPLAGSQMPELRLNTPTKREEVVLARKAVIRRRPVAEPEAAPVAVALTQGPALLAAARETCPVINAVFNATTKASFTITFALMSSELNTYAKSIEKEYEKIAFGLTLQQELLLPFKRFHDATKVITILESINTEADTTDQAPLDDLLAELLSRSPAFATVLHTEDAGEFTKALPTVKELFTAILNSIEKLYDETTMKIVGRHLEDRVGEQEKKLGIPH